MRRDVVIVGGGAMGAATAYFLARRGVDVTLLEQFTPGHDRGSSHGPSRIFRLAYRDHAYIPLAQQALGSWRELEDDTGAALLTTTGGLDHGDPTVLDDLEAGLRAHRAACTRMSAPAARERWPALRFDGDVLFQPDAGRIDADATVAALLRRASQLGVEVRPDTPVTALRPRRNGVDIDIGDTVLSAEIAVLAVGAWLPKLAGNLDIALPPLTVTQEQPAYFPAHDAAQEWPSLIHYIDPPRYGLLTPAVGVKVGEHGGGPVVDPDARPDIDDGRLRRVTAYVEQWLPGVAAQPARVDRCLYTTTPDESFVLRRFGPIVVCSACSGHGFKFVPVIGEQVAQLASS